MRETEREGGRERERVGSREGGTCVGGGRRWTESSSEPDALSGGTHFFCEFVPVCVLEEEESFRNLLTALASWSTVSSSFSLSQPG